MSSGDSAQTAVANATSASRESTAALEQTIGALEKENQNLQHVLEHRSASIAHLAHELRTPLTSILGFSEILLSQEQLTDTQRNFCERIQNSAYQLQRTLNELAELSRQRIAPDGDSNRS